MSRFVYLFIHTNFFLMLASVLHILFIIAMISDIQVLVIMEVASSRPDHLRTLSTSQTSENRLLGGGAADAGTDATSSASVSRRYRNELWTGIDTNTR